MRPVHTCYTCAAPTDRLEQIGKSDRRICADCSRRYLAPAREAEAKAAKTRQDFREAPYKPNGWFMDEKTPTQPAGTPNTGGLSWHNQPLQYTPPTRVSVPVAVPFIPYTPPTRKP